MPTYRHCISLLLCVALVAAGPAHASKSKKEKQVKQVVYVNYTPPPMPTRIGPPKMMTPSVQLTPTVAASVQLPPVCLLKISVGTPESEMVQITPNNDHDPVRISPHGNGRMHVKSSLFNGEFRLRFRKKGTHPPSSSLTTETPEERTQRRASSEYFVVENVNMVSFDFRGRFLKEFGFDDLYFATVLSAPVDFPFLQPLFEIGKGRIDPGMQGNLNAEQPWIRSPVAVTMRTITESPALPKNLLGMPYQKTEASRPLTESIRKSDGSEFQGATDKERRWNRKHYFANPVNLHGRKFNPDNFYEFDFANEFMNFDECSINLPKEKFGSIPFLPPSISVLPFVNKENPQSVTLMLTTGKWDVVFAIKIELIKAREARQ